MINILFILVTTFTDLSWRDWTHKSCVRPDYKTRQECVLRVCRACTPELFAPQSAHEAYCKWRKVWLPVCVCMCDASVRVVYVWGADCASAASCGRKQFSQLLKRCPKLSRHRRMFLTHASALFYRAPRGFTLSATLFQTWTWDKTCSGAAPDWLRRQSRLDLSASEQKSVTGSRLHQRLFAERRFRHLRVCRSKRLSLELSPRLAVFTEAHRGPMNHTWIHLTSWDTLHYIFGEFQHVYYNIRWTVSLFLNWCIV